MGPSIYNLSLFNLTVSFIPILVVLWICFKWDLPIKTFVYAAIRMVGQLLAIGFVLIYVFKIQNLFVTLGLLIIMFSIAAWIALRPLEKPMGSYPQALLALAVGGGSVLALIIGGVVDLKPWYDPHYLIPLAGMVFANSMNGLSLAAERFHAELKRGLSYIPARNIAFQTSMLPISNSFLAVGLVALPGMMTGQILAGVSPLIATRYQMMVMSMLFGATGITTSLYLKLQKNKTLKTT